MIQTVNNKCEVCNTATDNFDNLVNHYFDSNHNQNDLIMKVKNTQIRELLGLSKLPESVNNNNNFNIISQNIPNNILHNNPNQEEPSGKISYPDINNIHENSNCVAKNLPVNLCTIPQINSFIDNSNNNLFNNNLNNINNVNNNNNLNNNNNFNNLNNNNKIIQNNENSNTIKRICDICHVETEANYKGYAFHVIQNHNPRVLDYIGDKFLIEFILKGGTNGIKKCDICNKSISLDVNDYIVHIQKNHSNLINRSLSKYVMDKYVVSVLLGKSIYKTTEYWSTCQFCGEQIEGFEELREHMMEHKKIQNAYKGFFGHLNPNQVKTEVMRNLHKEKEEEQIHSAFCKNNINNYNNLKNNNFNQLRDFNLKSKEKQPAAVSKEEALEEFTNLLKNVNEALIINNVNSVSQKDAKDEEIKMLKEKLNSLEAKIDSMENQYKKDLDERDLVTAEIQNIMSSKEFKVADIQKELAKLEILEDRINENSKKIEDEKLIRKSEIDKINLQNMSKIKKNEEMLSELKSNFSKLNKDKNYIEVFHEQEKKIANIEKETLALKEDVYHKKPAEWQEQYENLKLVELPSNSQEYISIAKMFNDTIHQGTLTKITRIQNLELWKNFCYGKLQLKRKGNDTQKLLFHGTRGTDPTVICSGIEEGFDMRYANPSGYFGVAIYFHEKAAYSHDYRYSNGGFNFMLVANVLTGDSVNLINNDSSLRLPPFKDMSKNERYDSVNSQGKYMVYNNFRAYPAYLIQYT